MGKHTIVTGLAFGDEGKGSIVDYLVRKAENPLVVRHNGGSQAAHNVVTPDGKHHTFAQFGSGTLAGAPTHLSQFTVLNPMNMITEAEHLQELGEQPFRTTTVAESALIITPYHIAANRMREDARGDERHGSCGQGIGETVESAMRFPAAALRAGDLRGPGGHLRIQEKFGFWRRVKGLEMEGLGIDIRDTIFDDGPTRGGLRYKKLNKMAAQLFEASRNLTIVPDDWLDEQFDTHDVIFEGAQGVLLDERLGFHPHTTWSKTTPHNALLLLGGREAFNLGVIRTYSTRHGAGPFIADMGALGRTLYPEKHNGTGEYQGSFRRGAFDFINFQYAMESLEALGERMSTNGIAMTHMGRVPEGVPCVWDYDYGQSYGPPPRTHRRLPRLPTFHDDGLDSPSLHHQQRVTGLLEGAEPIFESMPLRDFQISVEDIAGDIVLESWGPTHEDKKDLR